MSITVGEKLPDGQFIPTALFSDSVGIPKSSLI